MRPVNKELITELKHEIDKENFREVKNIASDIEENEEKIIFHGMRADAIVNVKGMLQHSRVSAGQDYNAQFHLAQMRNLTMLSLTEHQFAQLIGRCRMYPHLPANMKTDIPSLLLGENQISTVVKDYYMDNSFCRDREGNINLWRLYNLFTGANKSSYIDNFIDRSVNAYHFV